VVAEEKPGVDSRDEAKHTEKNHQLCVDRMMLVDKRV